MLFQLNFLLFVYLFLNLFPKSSLYVQLSRTLSNSTLTGDLPTVSDKGQKAFPANYLATFSNPLELYTHPLIAKPWPISPNYKADLRTTIKLFARSEKLLTPEENSLRASLMAGDLPLGPSDAPCPVETSTVHGDSFFWAALFSTVIDKASWIFVLASAYAYRVFRPKLTPDMFSWAQISSLTPVSRHALVSPPPATAKLGFWLKGLALKFGPLPIMWPKPNKCDPTLKRKKSRYVLLLPLSISNQCLGCLLALDGRRHQPRKKSPSLLWDYNIIMRTLEVVSIRAMVYESKIYGLLLLNQRCWRTDCGQSMPNPNSTSIVSKDIKHQPTANIPKIQILCYHPPCILKQTSIGSLIVFNRSLDVALLRLVTPLASSSTPPSQHSRTMSRQIEQTYSVKEIPSLQLYSVVGNQILPVASSMEQFTKSSYASFARADYDHKLIGNFKLGFLKVSKDFSTFANSLKLCILDYSLSLYLYFQCIVLLSVCKNLPLLRI